MESTSWLVDSLNAAGDTTLVALIVNDVDLEPLKDLIGPQYSSKFF